MVPRTTNSTESALLGNSKESKGDRTLISAQNVLVTGSNITVANGGFHTHMTYDNSKGR